MKTLTYKEVLNDYMSEEQGNFLIRYHINGIEYIIYSPKEREVSCLELLTFKDISPFQLAVQINWLNHEKWKDGEFEFNYSCNKEKLIQYLFDIEQGDDLRSRRHVSRHEGYILQEVGQPFRARNFFQYNMETKEYQLVFDNTICATGAHLEGEFDQVNVCWNPVVFAGLEKQKRSAVLLASSNPILYNYVSKVVVEKGARINLYVDSNALDALYFIAQYIEDKEFHKEISIFQDNTTITISMKGWNPRNIMTFASQLQKLCNAHYNTLYADCERDKVAVYQCVSINKKSFVTFPNKDIYISIFLKGLIGELSTDKIVISE